MLFNWREPFALPVRSLPHTVRTNGAKHIARLYRLVIQFESFIQTRTPKRVQKRELRLEQTFRIDYTLYNVQSIEYGLDHCSQSPRCGPVSESATESTDCHPYGRYRAAESLCLADCSRLCAFLRAFDVWLPAYTMLEFRLPAIHPPHLSIIAEYSTLIDRSAGFPPASHCALCRHKVAIHSTQHAAKI